MEFGLRCVIRYRRRLRRITAAPCLLESPMWPSVVARSLPSYRTICFPNRCGNPSGNTWGRTAGKIRRRPRRRRR
eukprot:9047486-Pyramimonas_sp.AAC.1